MNPNTPPSRLILILRALGRAAEVYELFQLAERNPEIKHLTIITGSSRKPFLGNTLEIRPGPVNSHAADCPVLGGDS